MKIVCSNNLTSLYLPDVGQEVQLMIMTQWHNIFRFDFITSLTIRRSWIGKSTRKIVRLLQRDINVVSFVKSKPESLISLLEWETLSSTDWYCKIYCIGRRRMIFSAIWLKRRGVRFKIILIFSPIIFSSIVLTEISAL